MQTSVLLMSNGRQWCDIFLYCWNTTSIRPRLLFPIQSIPDEFFLFSQIVKQKTDVKLYFVCNKYVDMIVYCVIIHSKAADNYCLAHKRPFNSWRFTYAPILIIETWLELHELLVTIVCNISQLPYRFVTINIKLKDSFNFISILLKCYDI